MAALTVLELNPQIVPQFGAVRRNGAKPSGVVVVHTAENIPDLQGVDSGAENVAQFILTREDYGSYHDLADSDSILHMVPYIGEAWGAPAVNNHAYHVSGAVTEAKWLTYPEARRNNIVKNMAQATAWYAEWVEEEYGIIIPAKRITPAEARKGVPGFVSHAELDPARRKDPGAHFFWSLFLAEFARLRGIDTEAVGEPTKPVDTGTSTPVVTDDDKAPVVTEVVVPVSYLPLKEDGDQGEITNIELLRALKNAGLYAGVVKTTLDRDAWKAYQSFLARTEAYKGKIDGDFGKMSAQAEQIFLTALKYYNGDIDGLRGEKTIAAMQKALNNRAINADPIKVNVTVSGTGWVNPVVGRLTSRFGPRGGGYHYGDDIAPPIPGQKGVPVVAVSTGVVERIGYSKVIKGHTGNGVLVDHGSGIKSYYGHLDSISVSEGQKITVGDTIGIMGTTGNSTGIHLHLGVLVNDSFTPPYAWLKKRGVTLASSTTRPNGSIVVSVKPITSPTSPVSGREYDRQVQMILKQLGYYKGAIDGVNGMQQRQAVTSYQKNQRYFPGMIIDDLWGPLVYAHYNWVKELQTALNKWKGGDILVDGDAGMATIRRVHEVMQANKGTSYKGIVDGVPGKMFCAMLGIAPHPRIR